MESHGIHWDWYIYIYIPGTQMTLVLIGKGPRIHGTGIFTYVSLILILIIHMQVQINRKTCLQWAPKTNNATHFIGICNLREYVSKTTRSANANKNTQSMKNNVWRTASNLHAGRRWRRHCTSFHYGRTQLLAYTKNVWAYKRNKQ